MNRAIFNRHISASNFRELFITEMGWNNHKGQSALPTITVDEIDYNINCIAERNGFQILTCDVEFIPVKSVLQRIDIKLRRQANDYICVFIIKDTCHHEWVAPMKNNEKRELVIIEYASLEQADFLFSKIAGLTFELTESTTIMDVRERVQGTFAVNSEKITKDFYAGFRKEHTAFANFISGLDDNVPTKDNKNKQWYTSVMLNRLMFCYFIQKKGFLDSDTDYLRNKLEWVQREYGENSFYKSFYRSFLIQLFHEGLNAPSHNREFENVYGRIPYLNGGMFDNHLLEEKYEDIEIDDEAFIRLFNFFDTWQWHLDTRITASGKDINPDVLGYIFEQYINDRAAMGAYYTKGDITEYIGKNCIIPFLMDKVAESSSRDDFKPNCYVWQMVKKSGDAYIYDAVKKGHSADWRTTIPDYIAQGIDTTQPELLERRKRWNEKTSEQFALPTEIWRETMERLQRCDSLLHKIKDGEIQHINDFITYNLDIRQFAYDLLLNATDHRFVGNFYHALQKISILDPTCGSGAFLFAAMNILEPLYEVCISRMQEYNEQNSHLFKDELGEIANKYRSNIQYFIYKSIILRNLYGVDIMIEATEIAKLRLFLKMVAVVEVDKRADNLGLDPLPDVDFNIRCGNTLVGYANEEELNKDLTWGDIFANQEFKTKIEEKMDAVARTYEIFKDVQLSQTEDRSDYKLAKEELKTRLTDIDELLNQRMFKGESTNKSYEEWLETSQPFHWLAEFYQIIHGNGGFDVIIGNPPYVILRSSTLNYCPSQTNYSNGCGDLFGVCLERSISLSKRKIGIIIPLSLTCTAKMNNLKKYVISSASNIWASYYSASAQPSSLFEGVRHRLMILCLDKGHDCELRTTDFLKWFSNERRDLFSNKIKYEFVDSALGCCKISYSIERSILNKMRTNKNLGVAITRCGSTIYYHNAPVSWGKVFNFIPLFQIEGNEPVQSSHVKNISFNEDWQANNVLCFLNSNLFYWYNWQYTNCRDLSLGDIKQTPFSLDNKASIKEFSELKNFLMQDYKKNSLIYKRETKQGITKFDSFYPSKSKKIIDEIDKVLAKHYGFTDEELDFIINYDIKYRMGDELNNN